MKYSNYYLVPVALVIAISCQKEDIRPNVVKNNIGPIELQEQRIDGVDEIIINEQNVLVDRQEDIKVRLNSGPGVLDFQPEGNVIDQIPNQKEFSDREVDERFKLYGDKTNEFGNNENAVDIPSNEMTFSDREVDFRDNPNGSNGGTKIEQPNGIPQVDQVYTAVGELSENLLATSPSYLVIEDGFIRGDKLYLNVWYKGADNPDFHVYGAKQVFKSYPLVRTISVYNANNGEPELYKWRKAIIETDITAFKFQANNSREVILKIRRSHFSFSYLY